MKNRLLLCAALSVAQQSVQAGQFADTVINYLPGAAVFAGYDHPDRALGSPSIENADPVFGTFPVDPFGAPYLSEQLVSIGAGGSLTVKFDSPIANNPSNPFSLDFSIFGNSFFELNPPNYTTAKGTLGGHHTQESTVVSVSANGVDFFKLEPLLSPDVDTLFPTDGAGNFGKPVNPSLTLADFAGKDLSQIRLLYDGSGGGTSFDISWARDGAGNPVDLSSISYVKIDVLAGDVEIDALSAVTIPEPATIGLMAFSTVAIFGLLRRRKTMAERT